MGNESADCFRCIVLDSMNIMKKHFIMKHISFMMGKKVLAAVLLLLSGGTGTFAQEWIDVTSAYIKNADYGTGTSAWWTDGTEAPKVDGNLKNAEFFQKAKTAAQRITGLSAGTYKLTVRGFYRAGSNNTAAIDAYKNGTEVIRAFLFAGDASQAMASLYSATPNLPVSGLTNGYPNSMAAMRGYCDADPTCYVNELTFTVDNDNTELLVGIRVEANSKDTWTCWDDFKLYVEGTAYDLLNSKIKELTDVRTQLQDMGATSAAGELSTVIEQYGKYTEDTPEEDINLAIAEINSRLEVASVAIASCTNLEEAKTVGETLLADCTNGKYTAAEQDRQKLSGVMDGVNNVISSTSLDGLDAVVAEQLPVMNKGISDLRTVIAMNYSLVKAKELADRIGGLEATAEYVAVENALNEGGLEYDALKAAVQGLNAVCVKNMTSEFFASVTEENPIELTNFIVNPNIYQNNANTGTYLAPDGWNCDVAGSKDNHFPTTGAETDTDLYCYSWSGNDANNIGNGWYYQQIGGEGAALSLPRGRYVLKAATYSTGGNNAAYLYASPDNTSDYIVKSVINTNYDTYQAARTNLETTTATEMIEVTDGMLFVGMRGRCIDGEGYVRGSGKYWNADNFRLYYVGALPSVEELKAEVAELEAASGVLTDIGADQAVADMEVLVALYNTYTEETPDATVDEARENVRAKMKMFEVLPELYASLQKALTDGQAVLDACGAGIYYAAEVNQNTLRNAMTATEVAVKTATLDNIKTELETRNGTVSQSVATLCARVSFNDVLLKVKALADAITGLSAEEAYINVAEALDVETLTYDEMKADVAALNAACLSAMTPAFLAKASEEQPIDMTSFIVNPNIYQASDATKMPDGWNEVNIDQMWWDGDYRTTAKNTDSDLFCYCWSGNDKNNIGNGWYYQQIGGADGSIDLPDGLYILKAATYSTRDDNAAYLYAGTENTAEATVKARINRDEGVYQTASAEFATITATEVVEVRGGKLFIGMMGRRHNGEGAVVGNGNHWSADNFRLYYVGALKTTVNLTMKVDWATLMLPFDAELQEGMTAYSCASVAEDGMLNLVKVEDGLKANVPYIINAATGNQFEFTGISCAEAETYKVGLLTGVHNETEAPVASYVLQNQESDGLAFYRVAENKQPKVGANRAYLTLPETLGANVRVVYFPTDTDGVTDVEAADVMVDVYTLDGICVRSQVKKSEALKGLKGIYILKNVK